MGKEIVAMRLTLTVLAFSVAAAAPAFAAACRPALDPSMVRFVGRTPSSGPNPLFRLVGGKGGAARAASSCSIVRTTAAPGR